MGSHLQRLKLPWPIDWAQFFIVYSAISCIQDKPEGSSDANFLLQIRELFGFPIFSIPNNTTAEPTIPSLACPQPLWKIDNRDDDQSFRVISYDQLAIIGPAEETYGDTQLLLATGTYTCIPPSQDNREIYFWVPALSEFIHHYSYISGDQIPSLPPVLVGSTSVFSANKSKSTKKYRPPEAQERDHRVNTIRFQRTPIWRSLRFCSRVPLTSYTHPDVNPALIFQRAPPARVTFVCQPDQMYDAKVPIHKRGAQLIITDPLPTKQPAQSAIPQLQCSRYLTRRARDFIILDLTDNASEFYLDFICQRKYACSSRMSDSACPSQRTEGCMYVLNV